ncbi:MAG TPA: hypothetical protein VGL19_21910, partial [Polyangiaceae bacterium]
PAQAPAPEIRAPRRRARRWAGGIFSLAVVGACAWVLVLGVREGRIHVPNKADMLQRLEPTLATLRIKLDRVLYRQTPEQSTRPDE